MVTRKRRTQAPSSNTMSRYISDSKNLISIVAIIGSMAAVLLLQFHTFSPDEALNKLKNIAKANTKTNWEPKTQATVCNPQRNATVDPPLVFMSQSKEDRKLMAWFGGLCGGTYIEMGALNGKRYSNSYAFNNGMDWKGLLIEGSPKSYEELKVNRPNELFTVHAGVCGEEMMLHYVDNVDAAVRGFVEFAAESFQKRWWSEQQIKNAIEVRCRPLKDILMDTVGPEFHFDFFSLDIEGGELQALSSLDFDLVSFGIILVECDSHSQLKNMAVRSKLEANGYEFFMDWAHSYWFVNKDFERIYRDLIH